MMRLHRRMGDVGDNPNRENASSHPERVAGLNQERNPKYRRKMPLPVPRLITS